MSRSRGTVKMKKFGDTVREEKWRWFGRVEGRW